jgi:aspartyl-tRNA(Asn)/glutamyl-tRNA(Gln) amidotransferase subunit A
MMSVESLASRSALELAYLVRTRAISPTEIVEDVLELADQLQPRLNAFVVLDHRGARAAAKLAEAAVMRGDPLGVLHGVPATVKDVQAVEGLPTRRGSRLSDSSPASFDSAAVGRLRAAGAIIVGKTTSTEHGWTAVSESPLTGATHNPWRHGFTSGGSSAGAAALAASGCGPLHLGTDGAGSVRIPAHFCGVVGFKPTFGTVPYSPTPNNGSLSHVGPITRSVADAELMLEVMAGEHALDPTSHPGGYSRASRTDFRNLRIAFSPDLGHARVDPEVASVVASAIKQFEILGARVELETPNWGPLGPDLIRAIWQGAFISYAGNVSRQQAMDPGLVACIRDGAGATWRDISAALGRRLSYATDVGRWFEDGWDLLVTPSASTVAFEHGRQLPPHWPPHDWDWLAWAEFSYPFNLAHCPAVSIPCGLSKDGLPIGLQIVGKRFSDALVLGAAAAFLEQAPFAYPAVLGATGTSVQIYPQRPECV